MKKDGKEEDKNKKIVNKILTKGSEYGIIYYYSLSIFLKHTIIPNLNKNL